MKSGACLIAEERARHTGQQLGYSAEHDAGLADHELAGKAAEKIAGADPLGDPKIYGRKLVIAGALIAAEIDRLVAKHGGLAIPPIDLPKTTEQTGEQTEEEVEVETAQDLVDNNTKDELIAIADAEEVEYNPDDTKLVIAEAIIAKRAEPQQPA